METFKAQPIGTQHVPDLSIIAKLEIPGCNDLGLAADFYRTEGQKICDALYASLPGGILDGIMCAMMIRRASLFRVTFEQTKGE